MKKLIAFALLLTMLLSCIVLPVAANDGEEVGFIAYHNLQGISGNYNSSLVKSDTGSVNMDGDKSLKINTDNKSYTLDGNPDDIDPATGESKYKPEQWHKSRRSKLASFADNATIPAGEYYISVWVYTSNNGNVQNTLENLGEENHKHEIAISLHTAAETDESLGQNHEEAAALVKLFKKSDDTRVEMTRSGRQTTAGTRIWEEFTAKITTTEEYSQFCFWLIGTAETGEQATISTYVDAFSVYDEEYNTYIESQLLAPMKQSATEALDAKDSATASDAIKLLITTAKNAIESATSSAQITEILNKAIADIDAQAALDYLNTLKTAAKKDLEKVITDSIGEAVPSPAVLGLLEAGKTAIDAATSEDTILAAKNNAKYAINTQLNKEKAPAETDAPTGEASTQAPTPSDTTADQTDDNDERKGCGASVGALALLPVLLLGTALLRRRED